MTLRVMQPGLYTLVVDFGRPRTRSLGLPLGGAADRASLALGNALVGNPPEAAALEINIAGPVLRTESELSCVVYGAPFALGTDRQELRAGETFTLQPMEVLSIGAAGAGVRGYFCVHGGLQVLPVLGSRSGFEPLKQGETLGCLSGRAPRRFVKLPAAWGQFPTVVRSVVGPQADWFATNEFFRHEFLVSPDSNRMGLRLLGPLLRVPDRELASEPVCPGAVQVTRDGRCIVLGVDGQTIGGYPKIAQVISADLDIVGQLGPGTRLRFAPVSLSEAEELYRQRQQELREWCVRLRTSYRGSP